VEDNHADNSSSKASAAEQIVVLIHGIRTTAEWAELVRGLLERLPGVSVVPIGYGYFDVLRFLLPGPTRRTPVERVRRELTAVRSAHPEAFITVIAHSFGTYIISRILADEAHPRLGRLVLCGSIIPQHFRWDLCSHRVDHKPILNECGTQDIWPILAGRVTWGYGPSGTFGFRSGSVVDRFHEVSHSGFFRKEFIESYWSPIIGGGRAFDSGLVERSRAPRWQTLLSRMPIRSMLLCWLLLVVNRYPFGQPAQLTSSVPPSISSARPGSPTGMTTPEPRDASQSVGTSTSDLRTPSLSGAVADRHVESPEAGGMLLPKSVAEPLEMPLWPSQQCRLLLLPQMEISVPSADGQKHEVRALFSIDTNRTAFGATHNEPVVVVAKDFDQNIAYESMLVFFAPVAAVRDADRPLLPDGYSSATPLGFLGLRTTIRFDKYQAYSVDFRTADVYRIPVAFEERRQVMSIPDGHEFRLVPISSSAARRSLSDLALAVPACESVEPGLHVLEKAADRPPA
jgi:pimeloyl-ACP methyl ester carboxylesterase